MSLFISTSRRSCVFAALLIALLLSAGSVAAHASSSPVTTYAAAIAPNNSDPAAESQVVVLINQARARKHLKPLAVNATLTMIARNHSNDMMLYNYVSHTGKDGKSPFQRMRDAGYNYKWAGENIAAGFTTPEAAMNAWMHSAPHKRNILNSHFTEIGVGLAYGGGSYGYYWTIDFGSR